MNSKGQGREVSMVGKRNRGRIIWKLAKERQLVGPKKKGDPLAIFDINNFNVTTIVLYIMVVH